MDDASRRSVTLAGGQGMYGDDVPSVSRLLDERIDYLCLEALAELTVSILAKDRGRDESLGYTKDLGQYLSLALPAVADRGLRVITNAGGVNPVAAGRLAVEVARTQGLSGLKIATVVGDDLTAQIDSLDRELGLINVDDGRRWRDHVDDLVFANAYLGARPIVDALEQGADVVITGRVADPCLFLAPLVHEFGWAWDDYDRLACGIAVGHLSECGGQSTGGNFSGDWWTIEQPWNWAYPIVECDADGSAVLRKAAGVGGRVDFDTVRHQLLYEVHDPAAYLTPDVVADFTSIRLEEVDQDRVRISGATGRTATPTYKALAATALGWAAESRVAVSWPDAHAKAQAIAQVFRKRVAIAGLTVDAWHEEYWGVNALHGSTVPLKDDDDAPEVMLRVAWRCRDRRTAERIGRQMPPIGLSGPAWGVNGTGKGMIGSASQHLELWPILIDKGHVDAGVRVQVETV